MKRSGRVFVGLSGGVDSAVSAALLEEQGYDVVGVFIKIWQPEFIECTWREDRLDAMRVCAALSIPFREVDLSQEYKREVIDPMLREYEAGKTPNPDVLCNERIKFGAFLRWARGEGADYVATGHYARIEKLNGTYQLLRGADESKDQSYFLYRLTQSDLARTLFPVGAMLKTDVREKARALELPVARKHDSQGLCFVGDVSMPDFLRRFIRVERGSVLDTRGATIGEHEGAALYTVGERHGFHISQKQAARTPHYVVRIDAHANTIIVSPDRNDAASTQATLRDVHWIVEPPPNESIVEMQARYRQKPIRGRAKTKGDNVFIDSDHPQLFPPGQSLVIYLPAQSGQGDVCVGGGIIEKAS